VHHLLGRRGGVALDGLLAQEPEHDPLLVDHHAGLAAVGADALPDLADPVAQVAGGNGRVRDIANPGLLRRLPLARQIFLVPGLLAGDVVERVEPQRLEPPRGPG